MTNKTVMITGSSSGLGKEIALAFASKKNNVILHGRNEKKLKKLEDEIRGNWRYTVVGDIIEENTIIELVKVAKNFGIDILVNNAGLYIKEKLAYIQPDSIREVIETNLIAPILLTKGIFEIFKMKGSGLIININSIVSKFATEGESIYSASKCGLRGFSDSFKFEAIKYNIKIIDIYLGAMNTEITSNRDDKEKFIKTEEAADIIFSISKDYSNARISEIDILRNLY